MISATGEIINLPIITELSTLTKLVVKPSNLLPINSHSHLQITRTYQTAYQPTPTIFKSELINLPDEPLYHDLSLVPLTWSNKIAVYNTTDPKSVIASSPVGSPDLLLAKIPVGKAGVTSDGPRFIAVTSDATVAYTPLEGEGRVAVIDLISLQQVNTNHGGIDPTIALPAGAKPFSIVIGRLDKYAYVADRYPVNGIGQIYVIDIDPRSTNYNKHVQTIQVGTNLIELSQMALSRDGKSLFITAPKATDRKGHIIAVNVDITTEGDVGSHWNEQVGDLVTNLGVTGISAAPIVDSTHPERVQMVITNRQDDNYGFGVITVENGNFATASINYPPLLLGAFNDYFDVNEAVAVTITSDGKYAFVAGKNSRNLGQLIPSVDADSRAGSNIGIIKDPLASNAKLVAATLPIPDGWVNGLALSGDGKVLTAVYQGLGSGSIFAFDVEEMIETIEHPELFVHSFLGENSLIFNDQTRPATIEDLKYVPIDRINPAIDKIGADFVRGKDPNGQIEFTVPVGSKAPPLLLGGNTFSVTAASDWLNLTPVSATGYTEDLTPTFNWQFENPDNVQSVNLFISTFDAGEGLLPWDKLVNLDDSSLLPGLSRQQKEDLITRDWHGIRDYNPGRILTATWARSTSNWTLADGTVIAQSNDATFTVPDNIRLTQGAHYNWAVQASDNRGKSIFETGEFNTTVPLSANPFSSVTVMTHGFTLNPAPTGVPAEFYQMANSIIHSSGTEPNQVGLMLRYDKPTGNWIPVNERGETLADVTGGLTVSDANYSSTLAANIKSHYLHKALVLFSANPSATVSRLQPNILSAILALPWQYLLDMDAWKSRRFTPLNLAEASFRSAL